MAVTAGVENTCDAILAKLKAQLAARIDAKNAEVSDGILAQYPAGISLGERSDVPFPWINVMPSITVKDLDTGERLVRNHGIDIVSVVWDADEEALVRKLVRFSGAVEEVVLDKRQPGINLGDGGWGVQFVRSNYGQMVTVEPGFIKPVTLTVSVRQQQAI